MDSVPVPWAVVTATSTAPADFAGVVAVIEVFELTVNAEALVPPKVTAVAPVKFVPVIVTDAPPAVDPFTGESEATVGVGVKLRV